MTVDKLLKIVFWIGCALLLFSMVALAYVAGRATEPCSSGEVYVVDSGKCVGEDEHDRHSGRVLWM